MKRCKRCYRKMDDDEAAAYSPASDVGDIFISEIGDVNVADLCPECREELGILSLLGFEP
ncbi:MAG: hypothetical protein ACXWMJ_09045 [Syntrophales bacterium]